MASVTSATTQTTSADTAPKLADITGAKEMGKDDFLKLLVTQLKNQDPLKPMDNTEFVTQLAQFSQLDQSTQQVKLLEQSISNQNDAMQYALLPMIGRSVQVEGALTQLGTGPAPMTYALDRDASSVRASILDQNNKVIRTLDLGTQGAGKQQAQWDGRNQSGALMQPGVYQYQIVAKDSKSVPMQVATASTLTVTGVRSNNGQAQLVAGDQVIDRSAIVELQ